MNNKEMKAMKELNIIDNKDRVLIRVKDSRVLLGRYLGMDEATKRAILEFYTEFTGEDPTRARDFLDFNSEEAEFCS